VTDYPTPGFGHTGVVVVQRHCWTGGVLREGWEGEVRQSQVLGSNMMLWNVRSTLKEPVKLSGRVEHRTTRVSTILIRSPDCQVVNTPRTVLQRLPAFLISYIRSLASEPTSYLTTLPYVKARISCTPLQETAGKFQLTCGLKLPPEYACCGTGPLPNCPFPLSYPALGAKLPGSTYP
jgi:hypothetical protein